MIPTERPGFAFYSVLLLATLTTACGSEAQSAVARGDRAARSEVLEACVVVPGAAFAPLLGGPVTANGYVSERSDGWFSNCWFSGEERVFLTLNALFQPSRSTGELIESMGDWMDTMAETFGADDVDPEASGTLEPAEGFAEPAARHYDGVMRMHIVTIQHGDYWVQMAAPDLALAIEATRIALEHAP